jgi:hypothetical protein
MDVNPMAELIEDSRILKHSERSFVSAATNDGCSTPRINRQTRPEIDVNCRTITYWNSKSQMIYGNSDSQEFTQQDVIELKAYESLEFKRVTLDVLKTPLAEYIAEQVWSTTPKPNVRDCVRLASLCQTDYEGFEAA